MRLAGDHGPAWRLLPMEDIGIPILTALFKSSATSSSAGLLRQRSERVQAVICGRPSILIKNGKISEAELRELHLNINDLWNSCGSAVTPIFMMLICHSKPMARLP